MTRQEVASNFILNMERERVKCGYTQPQMATLLGLSASGYKKIVAGETAKIDLYTAYQLYRLSGKFIFELCGESSRELNVYQKFCRLVPSQKSFISGLIDFELAFCEKNFRDKNVGAGEFISVLVPTGCFEDGMVWDSANVIKVNAAPYLRKFGKSLHCGVMITSHHLQPVYHKGDILLISKRPPRDGDTVIFVNREEGRAYLRTFRQGRPARLEPVNEYGVPFDLDYEDKAEMDKWIKFGCVLTKMRL